MQLCVMLERISFYRMGDLDFLPLSDIRKNFLEKQLA